MIGVRPPAHYPTPCPAAATVVSQSAFDDLMTSRSRVPVFTVPATGSGGFRFDLFGIEESISEWEKLATDLQQG